MYCLDVEGDTQTTSTSHIVNKRLSKRRNFCNVCRMHTNSELCFSIAPKVLALNLFSFKGVLDKQI